jgi:two-component sensor histidine kinase
VLPKASLPLRLGLLVAGIVIPLTFLAVALVYYNYETSRQTAYGRVLQIARGLAGNIDGEFRAAIASLQVLALSEALQRDDLDAFRKQAEHFVEVHFPQSNVVVSDASGQQLLNTAVAPGTPLPRYTRMDVLRRVFANGEPQVSGLVFGPVLRRNIVVVDVPVWRDGKVTYDLGGSLPLSTFGNIVARQRPEPDWTIAVFDADGTVIARSRDPEQYIGKSAAPSLRGPLTSQFEGTLDTVTFDGIVVLTGFSRAPMSGWSAAVGIPKDTLTNRLWRSVAVLAGIGIICLACGTFVALRLATQLARTQADRELLINELNHRVKNSFATLQGLVVSTLRSSASLPEARKAVEDRIVAVGRAHDVLTREHWDSADLRELAVSILEPYLAAPHDRVELLGPDLRLNPRAAVAVAMVLNELMTNAAKYGALSQQDGRIRLAWKLGNETPAQLHLDWSETGGPPVHPPSRRGFGSSLIEQSIRRELGGTFHKDFHPDGLTCTIMLPLDKITA